MLDDYFISLEEKKHRRIRKLCFGIGTRTKERTNKRQGEIAKSEVREKTNW